MYDEDQDISDLLNEYGIEDVTFGNDNIEYRILPPQDELPEWCKD